MGLVVTGCNDQPWNNPNPQEPLNETIYYSSFQNQPKHLDPARSYSVDEALFIGQIIEPPLQYHFLKRPYELEPLTLVALPEEHYLDKSFHELPEATPKARIRYTRYRLQLKSAIFYQPHPAFATDNQGQPRYLFKSKKDSRLYKQLSDFKLTGTQQLTAEDYQYQIKRLADPKVSSPIRSLLAEYIVGFDEFSQRVSAFRRQHAHQSAWVDLDQWSITGVSMISETELDIVIQGIYPQFKYWLAMTFFAPTPRAVDRFYHNPGFEEYNLSLDQNPVGTGAFMMAHYNPNSYIKLVKNPNFRDDFYPTEGEPGDDLTFAGQKIPFIDTLMFRLEKESLPLFTKFMQGYYDRSGEYNSNIGERFDQVFSVTPQQLELNQALEERGITLSKATRPAIFYTGFNMTDPVVGGYHDRGRKLRQAIAIVYNVQEYISIFRNGQGSVVHSPIPPGVIGYPALPAHYNAYIFDLINGQLVPKPITYAKQLMAEAGYPNGQDAKTGQPLILYFDTTQQSISKPLIDWMRKKFGLLGIQLEFRITDYNRFQDKLRNNNTQLFQFGWVADYPDAENFLFLLYGPNGNALCHCNGVNNANYHNTLFDQLYTRIKTMADSSERQALIHQMVGIVQRDAPWIWGFSPENYYLNNAWVSNTKRNSAAFNTLKYLHIDAQERAAYQLQHNQPKRWLFAIGALVLGLLMILLVKLYKHKMAATLN